MSKYSESARRRAHRKSDKSGTRNLRRSLMADGNFIDELWASGYFGTSTAKGHVVVAPPITLPLSHKKLKPRKWRDTAEEVRALFYHEALSEIGNVRAFTLMLSADVENAAKAQGKHCIAWLHRRVVRELKRALRASSESSVPFWFAIEEADTTGVLHCHGEIVVPAELEPAIRKGLKVGGGNWDRPGTQLRFNHRSPDFRWAGYCVKNAGRARPSRRRYMKRFSDPGRWLAGFGGKAVSARSCIGNAQTLYNFRVRSR